MTPFRSRTDCHFCSEAPARVGVALSIKVFRSVQRRSQKVLPYCCLRQVDFGFRCMKNSTLKRDKSGSLSAATRTR